MLLTPNVSIYLYSRKCSLSIIIQVRKVKFNSGITLILACTMWQAETRFTCSGNDLRIKILGISDCLNLKHDELMFVQALHRQSCLITYLP